MTPEQEQQLKELLEFKRSLEASTSIPFNVDAAFKNRFLKGLENRPQAAITAPGGASLDQDNEARASINEIITALENLGLVSPN